MHFKDDLISDTHVKNYFIISCLKHFPGPTKFGPAFGLVFSSAVPSNATTPQIVCHYTILTNSKMTYKCRQKDIFMIGQTHGTPYHCYGYIPLRFGEECR